MLDKATFGRFLSIFNSMCRVLYGALRARLGIAKRAKTPVFILFLFTSYLACSKSNIPNTDIPDEGENLKVIRFCEQYRHAVENKNIGELLKLASERYYEDGGNTDPKDDIDYDGLRTYLTSVFHQMNTIRYEIRYRNILFSRNGDIYVDYTYSGSYRLPGEANGEWRHAVSDNRLVLTKTKDSYQILSGM